MRVFGAIKDLKEEINRLKSATRTVGFVPTMGALHSGHVSLVDRALGENDIVVVSIFVNPAQFNDKDDLLNYPRTAESDLKLLESTRTDVVFTPSVSEIYPKSEPEEKFELGNLEKFMEGAHRPGHFQGVARVVSKLFRIVAADKAYFGEKDFQQLAVIRKLAENFFPATQIIPCLTVREENGLAMSSRNMLLDNKTRDEASLIFKTLTQIKNLKNEMSIDALKKFAEEKINSAEFLKLEYFEIANDDTLNPLNEISPAVKTRAFIAVKAGAVRLIDNIYLNS